MTCLCRIRVAMAEHSMARKITCPMCDEAHSLPSGGIPALPTCTKAGHVTAVLREYQRRGDGLLQCTHCDEDVTSAANTAKLYCITCYEPLCQRCTKRHNDVAISRDHVTVPIDDDTSRDLFCSEHSSRLVRYFCIDDFRLICNACAQSVHKRHVIADLVRTSKPENGQRKAIYQSLDRIVQDLETRRKRLDQVRSRVKETLVAAKKEITNNLWSQMELIQKQFEKQECLLHEQIDQQYEIVEEHLSELEHQLDVANSLITELREKAKAVLEPFGDEVQVTSAEFPVSWFQKRFTNIQMPQSDPDWCLTAGRYTPGKGTDLGHLETMEGPPSDFKSFRPELRLLWKLNTANVVDVGFIDNRPRGIIYSTYVEKSTKPCGLGCFRFVINKVDDFGSPVNLPVPVPSDSGQFCAIGTNVTCSECIVLSAGRGGTWDVVIVQRDTVTCSTLSNELPPKGQPVAVAINSLGHVIVATLEDPDRHGGATSLRCYHREGHVLWCVTTTSQSGGCPAQLKTPWSIWIDPLDRILVADAEKGCVKIYDSRGGHLSTFRPRSTSGGTKSGRPAALCTNHLAEIYVALYDDRIVSKYTADGQFIGHVLKTSHPPKSICLSNNSLVVGTSKGIRFYELGNG